MISNDNNSELRVSVVKLLNNNIDDNVYLEEYINQECFCNSDTIHYNNDNYCDIHVYDFGDGHVVGDFDDYHGNCVFI